MIEKSSESASLAEIRQQENEGRLHHDPAARPGEDLGTDFWRSAEVVLPGNQVPISLRIDKEVLDWFKAGGVGYQARINAVLRGHIATFTGKKTQ
jgi:uncharacterized protein (DUF4415 family)